jgi:hypothetical protein
MASNGNQCDKRLTRAQFKKLSEDQHTDHTRYLNQTIVSDHQDQPAQQEGEPDKDYNHTKYFWDTNSTDHSITDHSNLMQSHQEESCFTSENIGLHRLSLESLPDSELKPPPYPGLQMYHNLPFSPIPLEASTPNMEPTVEESLNPFPSGKIQYLYMKAPDSKPDKPPTGFENYRRQYPVIPAPGPAPGPAPLKMSQPSTWPVLHPHYMIHTVPSYPFPTAVVKDKSYTVTRTPRPHHLEHPPEVGLPDAAPGSVRPSRRSYMYKQHLYAPSKMAESVGSTKIHRPKPHFQVHSPDIRLTHRQGRSSHSTKRHKIRSKRRVPSSSSSSSSDSEDDKYCSCICSAPNSDNENQEQYLQYISASKNKPHVDLGRALARLNQAGVEQFDGSYKVALTDWVKSFERHYKLQRLHPQYQYELACMFLTGRALLYQENWEAKARKEFIPVNWHNFKKSLLGHFCNTSTKFTLKHRLDALKMTPDMTLDEYIDKVVSLCKHLNLNDENMGYAVLSGLPPYLKGRTVEAMPVGLNNVCQAAHRFELARHIQKGTTRNVMSISADHYLCSDDDEAQSIMKTQRM